MSKRRFSKVGSNVFAVGAGASAAAFDQQQAAALDLLRAHRGPFALVLVTERGDRVIASMPVHVLSKVEPPKEAGDELAKRFLRDMARTLVEASSHFGRGGTL